MRVEFTLPDLGEGLTEAEITTWLVDVGDAVVLDQPLVEVETAKAAVQISAPTAGAVLELGGAVGEVLPVGALLAAFESADAAPEFATAQAVAAGRAAPVVADPEATASEVAASVVAASVDATPEVAGPLQVAAPEPAARAAPLTLASPATRAHATALGVDLAAIHGSGPAGRVTRADVDRAAVDRAAVDHAAVDHAAVAGGADADLDAADGVQRSAATATSRVHPGSKTATVASAPPADREEPLRGIRRQIARTMTASWQQIPHVTEFRELDATALVGARRALRDQQTRTQRGQPRQESPTGAPEGSADPPLTFLPFFALACTVALGRHPVFNASLDLDREVVSYHGAVHLGVATAGPAGLLVPVLRDAGGLRLAEISRRIAELVEAARAGTAGPGQLTGGTFTISNFGSYGTWLGTPIINPPQSAIAGFGRIRDAVVAVDGRAVVRPTLPIAVSADHRLIDGDQLGAFVGELQGLLENPVLLLDGTR